jgi:hypothetical protein
VGQPLQGSIAFVLPPQKSFSFFLGKERERESTRKSKKKSTKKKKSKKNYSSTKQSPGEHIIQKFE